jgi:hypothetical protein
MSDPELTVVIAATGANHTLRECLNALAPQVRGREIEVLVAASTADDVLLVRERFPQFTSIEAEHTFLLPELWGAGAALACGRILALTAANCIPDPAWVDAILQAHTDYHSAIGGVVDIAAGASLADWALYFIRFSAFMPPLDASPADVCADNGSYKRAAIADQLDWIAAHGFWDHAMNERLHSQMRSRWRDPRIKVTCERLSGGAGLERFRTGRALGRLRAAQFDSRRRAFQLLKTPMLPAVYLGRIARTVFRAKRHRAAFACVLPLTAGYLVCWAAGQAVGLMQGSRAKQ